MIRRPPRSTLFPYRRSSDLVAAADSINRSEHVRLGELGSRATQFVPDRKSTRLNSSHANISYAVFCLKKKTGRDHWGPLFTLALAGGGLRMGQEIGDSSERV